MAETPPITVNVHVTIDGDEVESGLLQTITTNHEELMTHLQELSDAVAANDSVIGSAVELLNSISERLDAALGDDDAVSALAADLREDTAALAAAVAANTDAPTEPETPVDPAPVEPEVPVDPTPVDPEVPEVPTEPVPEVPVEPEPETPVEPEVPDSELVNPDAETNEAEPVAERPAVRDI